jgi:hypothetical protein
MLMGRIKSVLVMLLVTVLGFSGCMSTNYLAPQESDRLLTLGTVYIVLKDGSEVRLKNCVLEDELLVGFTKKNQRVEVQFSQIRRVYYKQMKPVMPYFTTFSIGTVGISIWFLVAVLTAPSEAP